MNVKIGVLTDMSSLYADATGIGSVIAAKMAAADFMKDHQNVKVEVVSGDHQNKPDIGSQIANQWYDVDHVDMIADVPNSGVALAVSQIASQKNKVFVASGPASSDLTGPKCNANMVHWTYDTWMLANGTGKAVVKTGGDTWFFLTSDYAFGHALERDTEAVVLKKWRQSAWQSTPPAQHQRFFLVPVAGAGVEGESHRSRQRRRDTINSTSRRRIRHREGWTEVRWTSGLRDRLRCARSANRAGPGFDRNILLGYELCTRAGM